MSLTDEQATQSIRISITGVVTLAESTWGGLFFVQDSTGGVFVNNQNPRPAVGDVVQVTGVSHAGGFAPDIMSPEWKKLGTAPLPEPKPVSVERLMSGAEDGNRVEVSGVVRFARKEGELLLLELAAGGYRFRAHPRTSTNLVGKSLIGATVRVRGTAASSFNRQLRQILGVNLYMPHESDLIIEHLPGTPISELPLASLRGILQYHRNDSDELRIRVRGVVTYQRPGQDIFLQDETDGLQVRYRQTNRFAPGEIVEAVGFPVMDRNLPLLQDALLVRTKEPAGRVVSRDASIQELRLALHHGDMITLKGTLLDRSLRPLRAGNSGSNAPVENILTLQCSNYLVSVTAPATKKFAGLAGIPIGSELEVSGLCLLQVQGTPNTVQGVNLEAVQILLPDMANLRILQRPSWWTAQRLLTGLGILLAISIVGALWILMILRKNSELKSSIAEKIKAQDELQKAHYQLESRVEERTKELKFQMGARKEAEVRFDAIVAERTRIAQELHDTLLQGFTGVGLKLDALTNGLPLSLETTRTQLLKLLEQSDEYLVEARRAVWELRSPAVEKTGDFSKVLMKVGERALEGTGIPLHFSSSGAVGKPPPAVEDNLLRICEEAVTNAAKHARPAEVEVSLECTPNELRLRIRDDGCGFNPHGPDASKTGHFGLVGIRERAKSIAGNLSLKSHPGQGTEILVSVSLAAVPAGDEEVSDRKPCVEVH
jgi:signal transduction histidine kinase